MSTFISVGGYPKRRPCWTSLRSGSFLLPTVLSPTLPVPLLFVRPSLSYVFTLSLCHFPLSSPFILFFFTISTYKFIFVRIIGTQSFLFPSHLSFPLPRFSSISLSLFKLSLPCSLALVPLATSSLFVLRPLHIRFVHSSSGSGSLSAGLSLCQHPVFVPLSRTRRRVNTSTKRALHPAKSHGPRSLGPTRRQADTQA